MASFLSPLIKSPGAPLTLRNQRTGAVVASTLEAAFERETRNKGLLGRTGLPDGQALVIAPCNGVHTFFINWGASPRQTPLHALSRAASPARSVRVTRSRCSRVMAHTSVREARPLRARNA